jgi:N-acetylglucosamine-6-phosphate deacetylase
VKSEDTPGLGKVVHRDDGTFKLSEDDLAIGNSDANTSSRTLCQCTYCSSDSSISITDTAEAVQLQLLHPSASLIPQRQRRI